MRCVAGMRPCTLVKTQARSQAFKSLAAKTPRTRQLLSKQLLRNHAAAPDEAATYAESASPLTLVQFSIPLQVQFQEEVCVTGGAPGLGDWDVAAALTLKWSEGDHWVGECELPRGGVVEYKYIIRTLDSGIIWQEGDANMSFSVPHRALHIFVQDTWDMSEHAATVLDAENVDWQRLPVSVEELEYITQTEEGLDEYGLPIVGEPTAEGYQTGEDVESGVGAADEYTQGSDEYTQGYQQQGQYYEPGLDPALSSGEEYTDGMGDVVAWDPAVGEEYVGSEGGEVYIPVEGEFVSDQEVIYEQDGTEYYSNAAEPAEALYSGEFQGGVDEGQYDQEQYSADGQQATDEQYAQGGQYADEQYNDGQNVESTGYSGGEYDPDSNEYLPNQMDYSQPVYNSYEDPDSFGIEARVMYDAEGGLYQLNDDDDDAPKPTNVVPEIANQSIPYYQAFNINQKGAPTSSEGTEPQGADSTPPSPLGLIVEEEEKTFSFDSEEDNNVTSSEPTTGSAPGDDLLDADFNDTSATTFVFSESADSASVTGPRKQLESLDELPPFILSSQKRAQQTAETSDFERAVADAGAVQQAFPEGAAAVQSEREQVEEEEEEEPVRLESLTYGELQRLCRARGLKFYGRKAELLKRLKEAQAVA